MAKGIPLNEEGGEGGEGEEGEESAAEQQQRALDRLFNIMKRGEMAARDFVTVLLKPGHYDVL